MLWLLSSETKHHWSTINYLETDWLHKLECWEENELEVESLIKKRKRVVQYVDREWQTRVEHCTTIECLFRLEIRSCFPFILFGESHNYYASIRLGFQKWQGGQCLHIMCLLPIPIIGTTLAKLLLVIHVVTYSPTQIGECITWPFPYHLCPLEKKLAGIKVEKNC